MRVAIVALAPLLFACADRDDTSDAEATTDGCTQSEALVGSAPMDLRCTRLYASWEEKRVAAESREFRPSTELWSDGSDKKRWVYLPPNGVIDASDPDEWFFPVGTKVWKEFSLRGRRIETRYFEKTRPDKWVRATYVWSEDGASAAREDNGKTLVVDGAPYVVPDTNACDRCHRGKRDRLLGFEAIGLGGHDAQGVTLSTLGTESRLSPGVASADVKIPGRGDGTSDNRAARALSWLHVNCGTTCHNRSPDADAQATDLWLRIDVKELATAKRWTDLAAYTSSIARTAKTPRWAGEPRLVPGDPEGSLLYRLAASRGDDQMPPLATAVVDAEGTRAVHEWIAAMPKPLPWWPTSPARDASGTAKSSSDAHRK